MSSLEKRLRAELELRSRRSLCRSLKSLPPGVLDLASNDYLGLSRHPQVIEASCQAVAYYGTGARASRLVSGHSDLHFELETALAEFKGCEAALVFPSGYMANLALVSLAGKGDLVLCDKRNHASLIDACRLAGAGGASVRYYGTMAQARVLLETGAGRLSPDAAIVIVSDAIYSMDGDECPLVELTRLCGEFNATLILDDAHGTATMGSAGRGTVEACGLMKVADGKASFELQHQVFQVGTLSKALGSQGGFVTGPRWLIDWLVNTARPFIYTTALNAASCAAALEALRLAGASTALRGRLEQVKLALGNGLREMGFDARLHASPIVPVIVGEAADALALSDSLLEEGVWCPAIRPPTVRAGTSRLRVTASAGLADDDLEKVLSAFAKCRKP